MSLTEVGLCVLIIGCRQDLVTPGFVMTSRWWIGLRCRFWWRGVVRSVCDGQVALSPNDDIVRSVITRWIWLVHGGKLWVSVVSLPSYEYGSIVSKIVLQRVMLCLIVPYCCFNSSPLGQNGRHFADDVFKHIFLNENIWISLEYVPCGPIDNMSALVQIMAWRRPGDKP